MTWKNFFGFSILSYSKLLIKIQISSFYILSIKFAKSYGQLLPAAAFNALSTSLPLSAALFLLCMNLILELVEALNCFRGHSDFLS